MLCNISLSNIKAKSPRWRFNISLLSNQTFITSLKEYIKSSDDQVTTNPVAINDIFKGFYTNLYNAETDEPICKQYLDKLDLPRISQMDKESLEAPLSIEELHVSLNSLQKGKLQKV